MILMDKPEHRSGFNFWILLNLLCDSFNNIIYIYIYINYITILVSKLDDIIFQISLNVTFTIKEKGSKLLSE